MFFLLFAFSAGPPLENATRYDCASLVGYLLATGDFHEPTTR